MLGMDVKNVLRRKRMTNETVEEIIRGCGVCKDFAQQVIGLGCSRIVAGGTGSECSIMWKENGG